MFFNNVRQQVAMNISNITAQMPYISSRYLYNNPFLIVVIINMATFVSGNCQ